MSHNWNLHTSRMFRMVDVGGGVARRSHRALVVGGALPAAPLPARAGLPARCVYPTRLRATAARVGERDRACAGHRGARPAAEVRLTENDC